ncbi:hypothetical protein WMF28_17765 [Sorangium sp. So ce590]|uniref:hypothetical protein n=1 Tax=Sorangium sp. So ce590 TaxID=3133317 RepID=UPI003F60CE1D
MRSRPLIRLQVPRVVFPGETIDVGLSLDSATETPIDFVRVTLEHTQKVGSQGSQTLPVSRDLLFLSEDVAGKGRLGEGVHRYRVSFALPVDLPPSHAGSLASCRCRVSVLVSIPWWLNAEESEVILVGRPTVPAPKDEPFTSASSREHGAFVEVSLPRRTFAPGEPLAGAIAFGDLGGRRPFTLDVSLIAVERAQLSQHTLSSEGRQLSFFKDLAGVAEGAEVPFRIALPRELAFSYSAAEVSLEYRLEVTLEHVGGRVLHSVPVVIDRLEPRTGREGKRPPVGADRWRAVWASVGQRVGLSLGGRGLRLRGVRAGCAVEVAPAEKESSAGLSATVRFAEPWGLHLGVRPRGVLDLGGMATGEGGFEEGGFDRRFRVRGREEAQVLAALTPALRGALSAFHLADVDDAEARVWSAAGASDGPGLEAFLAQVDALARAIAKAGAALPPPAAMAAWLPAWRRFAEENAGALGVGSMRLAWTFEGGRFELETLFKGAAPTGTRLVLRLDPPIAGAGGTMKAAEQRIAATILEQAARLGRVADAGAEAGVAVAPGEISVVMAAPLADPAAAQEVQRPMLALAREMRGERRGGPYR